MKTNYCLKTKYLSFNVRSLYIAAIGVNFIFLGFLQKTGIIELRNLLKSGLVKAKLYFKIGCFTLGNHFAIFFITVSRF